MWRIHYGCVVAAVLVLAAACDSDVPETTPVVEMADSIEPIDSTMLAGLPAGASIEMLEEGRRQFVVCTVCHGLDASGTQLGPSLRDTAWIHISHDIAAVTEIIRSGVANPSEFPIPMPVMGGGDFTEEELRALAMYVYALGNTGR